MTVPSLDRRRLLAGLGLTIAFAGPAAAAPAGPRRKLVVLIARGAMDGLSVTVPWGDPAYAAHRRDLAVPPPGEAGGALALSEGFGLHPALARVHALHAAGQLRWAPAVAIPVRSRSHFDAQDVLETGGGGVRAANDGWLNRALGVSGGVGLSIGAQTPMILRGDAPTTSWAPGSRVGADDRIASLVQDLYVDDPLLGENLARGLAAGALADAALTGDPLRRGDPAGLGRALAGLMSGETGADIVALSLDGWDTHAQQGLLISARLTALDGLLDGLRGGLGAAWADTVVVVATEFGRTVRVNGTRGTDHGTASSLLLAGGALRPGGPVGDWPTLAEGRLYENRDLAPTLDVRSVFKTVLRDHLGLDRAALDARVFPDSAAEAPLLQGLV